jgi:hypothetical protein
MIEANFDPDAGITSRLVDRAHRLVLARLENRRLSRTRDPHRWHRAALLWPTFTGER